MRFKKNTNIMKKNITLFLTFLMMSIYSIALSKPTPDDAPPDFAPEDIPVPPPAPIDGYITIFLILTIVLAFVFFYNYKKTQNQYI